MDIEAERAYQTPFVNSTLLPMLLLSLARQKHTPETSKTIKTEYDFVIVGGGSAGSVVASRLSEMPCVSVLLLEAGKPPPLLTELPSAARFFWFTDIDWQYRTAPQRYTGKSLINRQVVWPSGKALGGTSILNGNIVVRGNRKNYDQWAAEGADGWSYKDVLPYFKKMEDNRDPEYVANGFHGVGGPETEHRPRYQAEYKDPLFKTIRSMGYKVVDPNAYSQTGFYDIQGTLRAGQRCSTAKAYLVPAENRPNLDILPNAMVRKVVMKNKQAVGVEFDFQNTTYVVKARREVIMSAGTVNTAQLLMLSGIGPRKELERFRIPIVADLPVGRNLQDHTGSFVSFLFNPDIPRVSEKLSNPANIAQYIQNRTGPLTSTELISVIAFLENNAIVPETEFPDHQLYFNEAQSEIATQVGLRPEVFARVFGPYVGRSFYLCVSSMLHPRSRGTVTLQSTDPYDPPVIDPNYFEDPKDITDVVEGLKTCMRIGTHPIMRKVGSFPFGLDFPGCEKFSGNEDLLFRCLVEHMVITFNHQVGTARMGHPEDPRTVVDPHLRVLKVKGLRVVDASVMPLIPSGNTNIPTIMVAEKASDIIKSTLECYKEDDKWNEREPYETSMSEKYTTSTLPNTVGRLDEEGKWIDTDYPVWADPQRYPTDSAQGPHDLNVQQENDYSFDEVDKPWVKNLPKPVPWNEENLKNNPWNKENPVDQQWNKDAPVDQQWSKEAPVDQQWNKEAPVDQQWNKEAPVDQQWNKEAPVDQQWNKEAPVDQQWDKEIPVDQKWKKEIPVDQQWGKETPVDQQWNKEIPVDQQWNKEIPLGQEWNKEIPLGQEWNKEIPLGQEWNKEIPLGQEWNKEIPLGQEWIKETPVDQQWNKQNPVNLPFNKEIPIDVQWNKDIPIDMPWGKEIPVDTQWDKENQNHKPVSGENPSHESPNNENPKDEQGNKNNPSDVAWSKENPNHEPANPNHEPQSKEIPSHEPLSKESPNHEPQSKEIPSQEPLNEETPNKEPTSKESPKVTPWNQEIIQSKKSEDSNNLIDIREKKDPENQGISQQVFSNNLPFVQQQPSQRPRPPTNILPNIHIQKGLQVQIKKTPPSQLPMRINEIRNKIQEIIDQLLLNPRPPNAPSNSARPNGKLNLSPLNSPLGSSNQMPPKLLKEMKMLKDASACDEDFCNSLLKFKQCRQYSCKKRSEFVTYVHKILCSS